MLSLILTFLLTACGGGYIAGDPDKEINYYVMLDPVILDPQITFFYQDIPLVGIISEGLMKRDRDGKIVPGLADSYEVDEKGIQYTFHIRDDARFSNGEKIRAEDFVFAWQRMLDPDSGSEAVYIILNSMDLEGAEDVYYNNAPLDTLGIGALDDSTLTISLNKPCPYLFSLLSLFCTGPCNEEYYYSHKDYYCKKTGNFISSGPYMVDYFEPRSTQIHFRKNPYYYDAASISVPGVNMQVLTDQQQLMMSFEKGEADIIPVFGELLEIAGSREGTSEIPGGTVDYFCPNSERRFFQNKNIRIALSLAVDREKIANKVLKFGYTPAKRLIPPNTIFDSEGKDLGEETEKYRDTIGYDPDLARQYWEKGLSELGVTSITADFIVSADPGFIDFVKQEWERCLPGFKMDIRSLPGKAYLQEMNEGNYDICYAGWAADYSDPTAYLSVFRSDSLFNFSRYRNEEYDRILDECGEEPLALDEKKRNEKLQEVEDMLIEDAIVIPLFFEGSVQMISPRVKGVVFNSFSPVVSFNWASKEEE